MFVSFGGVLESGVLTMAKRIPSLSRGFSLVEVAISLGILSFTLLPLIGLLTMGMTNNRDSADRTIEAQIMGWSQGDLRTMGTNAMNSYTRTFDDFGISSDTESPAFVALMNATNIALPGASSSSAGLKMWTVELQHAVRNDKVQGKHMIWYAR